MLAAEITINPIDEIYNTLLNQTLSLIAMHQRKYDSWRRGARIPSTKSKQYIESFIKRHLYENDGKILFKGEDRYVPIDWEISLTSSESHYQKIVRFIVEKNTVY